MEEDSTLTSQNPQQHLGSSPVPSTVSMFIHFVIQMRLMVFQSDVDMRNSSVIIRDPASTQHEVSVYCISFIFISMFDRGGPWLILVLSTWTLMWMFLIFVNMPHNWIQNAAGTYGYPQSSASGTIRTRTTCAQEIWLWQNLWTRTRTRK